MTKALYVGVDNVAKNVKGMYVGVDGTARKVIKAYVGVDGVARLFYESGPWSGRLIIDNCNIYDYGNGFSVSWVPPSTIVENTLPLNAYDFDFVVGDESGTYSYSLYGPMTSDLITEKISNLIGKLSFTIEGQTREYVFNTMWVNKSILYAKLNAADEAEAYQVLGDCYYADGGSGDATVDRMVFELSAS